MEGSEFTEGNFGAESEVKVSGSPPQVERGVVERDAVGAEGGMKEGRGGGGGGGPATD